VPADHSHLHVRARERGVNPVVYWLARAILQPIFHLYFRLSRIGREHIPQTGPVILASNHRSFLDPFVIGTCARRPIYYVAKRELFQFHPLLSWLLSSLGAFPVHRGVGDGEMIATAKAILERGDAVLMFPEGTRTRPGALGRPKRGVGRLALESGAPVVPVATFGTEDVRKGWRIRPRKVRIRIGRALTFPRVEQASPQLAAAVTDRIWPNVMLQWEWLGGMPPLRRAAVIGAAGASVAAILARAGLEVDLGAQPDEIERELPPGVAVTPAAGLELSRHDLVCLAVPADALPATLASHADAIPPRAGVLVMSRGLVPPLGTLPSAFVSERVGAWAVGALGGPAAPADGASLVLAAADPAFARQVGDALAAAGVDAATTSDVVGVELAGCAANAAALASAAAARAGANAAGVAAGKVFAEVDAYARRAGARPETFAGMAGAGDLVAAVMAGDGELPAGESVPLLAARVRQAGVEAPVLGSLAGLIEGRVEPERWTASLTAPRQRQKARAA
jgi:glycerol-3-phosphate dehydrogenase (NAD(P)+)